MGKINRKVLDKETGDKILVFFETEPEWKPTEIPYKEIINIPGLVRREDTFSIWISGSYVNPQFAHNLMNVIAGIDVLVNEPRPNLEKAEPSGNAYHYYLQKINDERYPYILYGPFDQGTMISHWFDNSSLDVYWNGSAQEDIETK